MEFLVPGLAALVAAGVAILRSVVSGRRRAALFQFATRFGLDYAPNDPFGLIDHRFDLFDRADGARCQNVVWGNWHGVDVKVGELRFTRGRDRRRLEVHRTTKRYSFAIVEFEAWLPHLSIRHDPLAGLSEDLLLRRLRFESDAFNRMYRVDCPDERFAYKFVDARMMLWLQEVGQTFRFDFEVNGKRGIVWCARLEPNGLIPLFGAARGFVEHVPQVVLQGDALEAPSY